jgi:hypothetical protein
MPNSARTDIHVAHAQQKLWQLASSGFSVLGEARVADDGIALSVLGDRDPESKLGLAPGSFPRSIEAAIPLMHPEDAPSFQATLRRSLETGQPFNATYRLADGRGGWRWIEGQAVPVEVRAGRAVGWVFTNRDLTAQREAEAALRHSLEELESSRVELRSEQDKLWRLAANAFSILGEARITESGMDFTFFGDGPLEERWALRRAPCPTAARSCWP